MLRYAGVELLLEDPDGRLCEFVENYLSLEDLRLFGMAPQSVYSGRYDELGLPNYPPPLKLRFNTLYQPTGATRWAFGLFLATKEQTDQIIQFLQDGEFDDPAELVMRTGENQEVKSKEWSAPTELEGFSVATFIDKAGETIKEPMYLLDPRPVADDPDGLWMLPLVDHRYYWQQTVIVDDLRTRAEIYRDNSDEPSPSPSGDDDLEWDHVFGAVATALNIHLYTDSEIPSEYGAPPDTLLDRSSDNPAVLLDILAHSIGRRVVYGWSTDVGVVPRHRIYHLMSWTSSQETAFTRSQETRVDSGLRPVAGGQFATAVSDTVFRERYRTSLTPEKLTVLFPKSIDNVAVTSADSYFGVTEEASDHVSHAAVPDTTKVIYSSCSALYSSGGAAAGDPPVNETDLQDLAGQIASDYFASLSVSEDQSFTGITPLFETGFDNWIHYSHGFRRADGTYSALTRVQTAPYNFGTDYMQHGASSDGDGDECPAQNEIQRLTVLGQPTGGNLDLSVTVGGVTENVVVNYNYTASEFETALEGHSEVGAGNVDANGGPLPNNSMTWEFVEDLENTAAPAASPDVTDLTGGTGVGAIVQRLQIGRP